MQSIRFPLFEVYARKRTDETKMKTALRITFENRNAEDLSGCGNHGAIVGTPRFVEGYDGGLALCLRNPFGRNKAVEYVRFDNLKGIDLTKEDFTVMFWYKTE